MERLLAVSTREMVVASTEANRPRSSRPPCSREHDLVVTTIPFDAPSGSGRVALLSPRSFASDLEPSGATTDAEVCDALGELANLTAGRLKTALLMRGVPICIGTPTTGIARSIRIRPGENPFPDAQQVVFDRGLIFVHLLVGPTRILPSSLAANLFSGFAAEGKVILFDDVG